MQIIVDEQTYLREIQLTDAETVFQLIDQDRNRLRKWLNFVDHTREVKDTAAYIQSVLHRKEEERDFVFVMVYQKEIVGLIGFRETDYVNRKTEIGYWICEQAEGKRIVSKATRAMLNFAFNNLEMNRVMIRHAIDNERSGRIPQQLGFLFEGIERQGERVRNKFHDLKVYSLLKSEWQI